MKKVFSSIFHPTSTRFFWINIILGVIGILLGILLMPVWGNFDWAFWKSWGKDAISIVTCICILLYLFLYLLPKILTRSMSVVKILTILEFVLLFIVALGCVFQQFKIINIANGSCAVLGMVMWCRGTVEVFRAYYHQKGNNDRYPLWWLVLTICLVTFGTCFVVKPVFDDIKILWIISILIIVVSLVILINNIKLKYKK